MEDNDMREILFDILDAETSKEKIGKMRFYRDELDERTLGNIAAAFDVSGDCQSDDELFEQIVQDLTIKARYETDRLR